MNTMEAVMFALMAFMFWGVSDLFVTIAGRKLGAYSSAFWSACISSMVLTLYVPFAFSSLLQITPPLLFLNIVLGVILMIGVVAYREGLVRGNSSLIVTISASFTVVTTILSIIFFHERPTVLQIQTIIIVFIGLIIATLDFKELKNKKINIHKGVPFAIVSTVAWGVYFTFIKIPVKEIGWFWPNYISFWLFPLLYLYIKFRRMPLHKPTMNNAFFPLLGATLFARLAEFSFNAGIAKGYTSIVAPLAGASPVLFVILAFFFLKDPITKQQLWGICITLLGIIALSLFSV